MKMNCIQTVESVVLDDTDKKTIERGGQGGMSNDKVKQFETVPNEPKISYTISSGSTEQVTHRQ